VEDGPSDIATRGGRRWPAFLLAAAAALAGALLAPAAWPDGRADLEVVRGDAVVAVMPVVIGDPEARVIEVGERTFDGIGIVLDLIGMLLLVTVITWLWGLLGVT